MADERVKPREFDPADPSLCILRWVSDGEWLAGWVEVRHCRPAVKPSFDGPVKFALAERVLYDLGDGTTYAEAGREPLWPSLEAAIADFRDQVRMALLDGSRRFEGSR